MATTANSSMASGLGAAICNCSVAGTGGGAEPVEADREATCDSTVLWLSGLASRTTTYPRAPAAARP